MISIEYFGGCSGLLCNLGGHPINSKGKVSIVGLKKFVKKELPENSVLRESILAEEDTITPEDYLAKIPIWLKMLTRKV